jgi:uncharacterized protein YcbK (DUF882 family)
MDESEPDYTRTHSGRRAAERLDVSGREYANHDLSRRRFVGSLCGLFTTAALMPRYARAEVARELRFYHTHTDKRLSIAYRDADGYVPEALDELNSFLADFRTGEQMAIDPGLFDILSAMREHTRSTGTYEVISAYRSPATNAALHAQSAGVAEHSLHMVGKAIDLRLTGVELDRLRDTAWSLQLGGVGYYPGSNFIHVDTGRVRHW